MKQVVTLGGGTGTFVVLGALRTLPELQLTAIVSGADDGGSTGHLRDAYGFLPTGDVRQALVALSEEGSVLRDLFAYRFDKGNIAGHNLGNLFLTALTDILGSDAQAVEEASRILRISGTVMTSTEAPAVLSATLEDNTHLIGEHIIDERDVSRPKIVKLSYQEDIPLSASAQTALMQADYIILGPGDLYTSTVAALLATGTREVLTTSSAKLLYIVNLFTKAGQTTGLSAQQHIDEIERYAGRKPDTILLHSGAFSRTVLERYASEHEYPVVDDVSVDTDVLRTDLVSVHVVPALAGDPVPRSLVRHDSGKLAKALTTLIT